MGKTKHEGYWKNLSNVRRELSDVVVETGYFPTQRELIRRGYSSLSVAITYHGGFHKFRDELGHPILKKMKGYWKIKRIRSSIDSVIIKLGYFPSFEDLVEHGPKGIGKAVSNYGGLSKLRRTMGYESKNQRGYWNDGVITEKLESISKELGHFPTHKELRERYSGLSSAISAHGGIEKFRRQLDSSQKSMPDSYCDITNVQKELKTVIAKEEYLQSKGELIQSGKKASQKPAGHWKESIIESELETIIKKIGGFPTQQKLKEYGSPGIINAINRQGGLLKFRLKLGYPQDAKPSGYWNDATIISELEPILFGSGHFPSRSELLGLNRLDLDVAIGKHGGYRKFQGILNHSSHRKPNGYWDNITNVESVLMSVVNKKGYFPSQKELIDEGYSSLSAAIVKHGGVEKLKQKLGYDSATQTTIEEKINQSPEITGFQKLQPYFVQEQNERFAEKLAKHLYSNLDSYAQQRTTPQRIQRHILNLGFIELTRTSSKEAIGFIVEYPAFFKNEQEAVFAIAHRYMDEELTRTPIGETKNRIKELQAEMQTLYKKVA